ncbi:unnamed protein product [Adineta ricciae]|uniref:Uncharacterized protein n=1 Tax=Adineta ricciae TaxID=249248 RepID=A0A815VM84_ADIRI|nr:unnamed protein product [Adineta ricciae]CAF1534734.1 unnamed protein product [Adineta ricciae]
MIEEHRVETGLLDDTMDMMIVAGTDKEGSASDQLNGPAGIFVDTNLDLYVADSGNHRIQLFSFGKKIGKTVVGLDSPDITIMLACPYSVILDANKYLFISDHCDGRIVASGPNGFRCLVGCDKEGSQSHQLKGPRTFSFDVDGNLYVADGHNGRVQKFDLQKDSCKTVVASNIQTIYSSTLTKNHTMFSRTRFSEFKYHYEAIKVVVSKDDFYTLTANSNIDLYGHVYKDQFDPHNPTFNIIAWNGKHHNQSQYQFTLELLVNITYIWVVTTYEPNVIGSFSITALGSKTVRLVLMDIQPSIESIYTSMLTAHYERYSPHPCDNHSPGPARFYEAIEITVNENGTYTVLGSINMNISMPIYIYKRDFHPHVPFSNLLRENENCYVYNAPQITVELLTSIRYILVASPCLKSMLGAFVIKLFDRSSISFQRINTSSYILSNYSSHLSAANQLYHKACDRSYFYYETVRLTALIDGYYGFWSVSPASPIEIYIYKNHFDPLSPHENSVKVDAQDCFANHRSKYAVYLWSDVTYILLITTLSPSMTTQFIIDVYGPASVSLQRIVDNSTYCRVGGPCNVRVKSIGLTLDDILRLEVNRNMAMHDQSFLIKISGALTVLVFIAGFLNSACSVLTFQNPKSRTVGCGLYLLASSLTSIFTIIMFTIKFWFVVVTQMNTSVPQSALRGGCKSIKTLLKLFFYSDAWLNACVAAERAVSVYQGVGFDKEKSKRWTRRIIFILPIVIMSSIIHELLHRQVFTHEIKGEQSVGKNASISGKIVTKQYFLCITSYSQSLQDYNTAILFIHLLGPFIVNLLSALFIIIGGARRRAEAQKKHTLSQHIREQWNEHKQLVISPIILVLLSTPRLVISLLSECTDVSRHTWLYLSGYFISFIPSILVFAVFVLPSNSYWKTFKESLFRICKRQRS